ncbi:MAG: TetR family transcriptional regulator, partial [Aeromicrobium sp.]|nr:TetR family transcriptional regulator [Aeromicrobium sp.]
RELAAAIAGLIRQVMQDADVELAVPAEEAATVLLSLGIGLGALRSLDSKIDVGVFADLMRTLLRAPSA